MIFNIQRYSTHDGPGIRTVVFLKGCSLGCRWCQNPESRARTRDLLYDARLCLDGCDLCAQAAPEVIERALSGLLIHREKLTDDALTALTHCCPTQALTVCGEVKSCLLYTSYLAARLFNQTHQRQGRYRFSGTGLANNRQRFATLQAK